MPVISHKTVQHNRVFRFPDRVSVAIRLVHHEDGWFVLAREHGWLHGSRESAVADARWLSRNLGLRVLLEAAA